MTAFQPLLWSLVTVLFPCSNHSERTVIFPRACFSACNDLHLMLIHVFGRVDQCFLVSVHLHVEQLLAQRVIRFVGGAAMTSSRGCVAQCMISSS